MGGHRSERRPQLRALRDLILISVMVAGALLVVGAVFDASDRLHEWSQRVGLGRTQGLAALAAILALGLGSFTLFRLRDSRREREARVQTESALRESEQRYRALVEHVPAVTYTWDPSRPPDRAPIVYMSPQIESVLGYGREEWTTNPDMWVSVIHPEDRDRVIAESDHNDRSGEPFNAEYRVLAKDGRLVWVRDEATVVARDEHGRPQLVQGVLYDITVQKRYEADLKAAQERLREAEEQYRTLVEQLPAVTYMDAIPDDNPRDLKPIYISPQIESLVGLTPQEWIADPDIWTKVVHPDDRAAISAEGDEKFLHGEPLSAEYRMVAKDGRVVWIREEAVLVRDEEGNPRFWQGVYLDITGQKEAAERVQEAEARFRALVENMAAVSYSWDMSDHSRPPVRYASPQIEALLGLTPEEWVSDPDSWTAHVHPDDVQLADRSWGQLLKGEDHYDGEYRMIHRDGNIVWIRDQTVVTARDEDGRPVKWQGVFFDITDRKRAEEQLREAEARYRVLVEQLPVVVYIDAVDEVSTAMYVSPQYERLLGYTAKERVNDPGLWVRLLHPDDRDRVTAESNRTNRTGDPFSVEYRLIAKDGNVVWVRDEAELLRGEAGEPLFWQGVMLDITERKRAEESLRRRDTILEAVGFAAESFLRTTSWEDVIEDVLERLVQSAGVSRAYVYENHANASGDLLMSARFEWCVPGVRSIVAFAANQGYPYRPVFDRWVDVLGSGGFVHGPSSELPVEERSEIGSEDALSIALVPIPVGDEWWGFIGLDDCVSARKWSQAELEALRAAANTLGAAIGRRQAEAHVREAEEKYRTLVEQVPAVIYITTPGESGRPLYTSPQVEALLGYTAEEWAATAGMWQRHIHPDDRERVLAEDALTDETGEPFHAEYRFVAKDGRTVWVRDDAVLIRDPDGAPQFWQGVRLDITARKQAEQQLREAEEKYRTLVERVPAIIYSGGFGKDAPFLYVSPQVETLLGYTPEEWMADPEFWQGRIHPDDIERVMAEENRSRETREQLISEYRMFARDGSVVWIRDEAETVMDERGRPQFLRGIMMDITERKTAEEQLQETEAKYRALVEQIPAVLYIDLVDDRMTPVYVSPQLERLVGLSPEEYMRHDQTWEEHLHPDDRERAIRESLEGARQSEPFASEYRMITPDARTVWIRDEAVVLKNDAGEAALVQGVMFDITEQKLAEQALQESERREREAAERLRALDEMKNTFLAAVSHELRSPLTSILGLSLTLERHNLDPADETDLLARLSSNARKLDGLLRDLLDIDRLSRGIVQPQLRPMELGALVRRTVESLDVVGERPVLVETDPVVVPVDPPKVERIVENLIVNAARHTDKGAGIWVRVIEEDDGATIAVEDDGPGVPPDIREAIFEPFRQGPSASPHAPGTGIGLSLVARFAELHGGRAWVQERDGGGASFRVFLPSKAKRAVDGDWGADRGVAARRPDRLAADDQSGSQPSRPAAVSPDRRDGPDLRVVSD